MRSTAAYKLVPRLTTVYKQHTDISFEPIPSDYAMLQLRTLPKVGGDTMWSSMYSAYDGLSPAMQRFLEGLTAVHDAEEFREQSQKFGFPLYTKERGHPDNVGSKLHATHPCVLYLSTHMTSNG